MKITASDNAAITLVPFLHGKIMFTEHVRRLCLENVFDCIAVDLPEPFEPYLADAIDELPVISAVIAQDDNDALAYFVPIDPCDAAIEGIRQGRQNHINFACIGYPLLRRPTLLPSLPDDYAISKLGFDEYSSLCLRMTGNPEHDGQQDIEAQHIAYRIDGLKKGYKNILALVNLGHFTRVNYHMKTEKKCDVSFPSLPYYSFRKEIINPDHLYFVLGELPFVTAKFEKTRHESFSENIDIVACIKDLFRETRDNYNETGQEALALSPARIQRGLQFLRNLTVMNNRLIPTLFDIVASGKGVGGNSYALHLLKCARYYPYLPQDINSPLLSAGIDRIILPGEQVPCDAVNFLRDFDFVWKKLSIKPDPSEFQKQKYRFSWNPQGACSHIPEDLRIENFNSHIRNKAMSLLREAAAAPEKFTVSVSDGIDMRETLAKWHTGDIYVKELPPARGGIDAVVIIFDSEHDERYPHLATWYAEHEEESTLTFYSTNPLDNLTGPGIARSYYGGLSLLFPPRSIPNIFEIKFNPAPVNLSEYLTLSALLFGREKRVAFVSKNKPDIHLRKTAAQLKKQLVWIPLSTFSSETLKKLRTFHVLNGKEVRSWATRFIGD